MRILLMLLLALTAVHATTQINKWALLVAGSNGYYNYRHQADICHAYQILHENGYPDSNIIVMMYDDIANSSYNPYPGVIINRPNGNNVYDGVPKDYVGKSVNPHNFLAVLTGNASAASGRVIPSNPENDIFVYFADHGGPGLIAFPNNVLYSHQLINALSKMYINNQYRSIVFYMEACESGSMFNLLLPRTTNIYAVTAATPDQSSWAAYCGDNIFNTCLGDVFSVNFLQNSDGFEAVVNETLYRQYEIVLNETRTSHVCAYGDLSIRNRNVSHYLVWNTTAFTGKQIANPRIPITNVVDTRNYKIEFLMNHYAKANTQQRFEIMEELHREIYHDELLSRMYGPITPNRRSTCYPTEYIDTKCLEVKVNEFIKRHGTLTESFFKYIRKIGAECLHQLD